MTAAAGKGTRQRPERAKAELRQPTGRHMGGAICNFGKFFHKSDTAYMDFIV